MNRGAGRLHILPCEHSRKPRWCRVRDEEEIRDPDAWSPEDKKDGTC